MNSMPLNYKKNRSFENCTFDRKKEKKMYFFRSDSKEYPET